MCFPSLDEAEQLLVSSIQTLSQSRPWRSSSSVCFSISSSSGGKVSSDWDFTSPAALMMETQERHWRDTDVKVKCIYRDLKGKHRWVQGSGSVLLSHPLPLLHLTFLFLDEETKHSHHKSITVRCIINVWITADKSQQNISTAAQCCLLLFIWNIWHAPSVDDDVLIHWIWSKNKQHQMTSEQNSLTVLSENTAVNKERHQNILQEQLLPTIQEQLGEEQRLFQHDGAPCHEAKVITTLLWNVVTV